MASPCRTPPAWRLFSRPASSSRLFTHLVFVLPRPALDEAHELGVGWLGQDDAKLDVMIAGGRAAALGNALALKAERRAAVRAGRHFERHRSIDRRRGDGRTEYRLRQADRELGEDVAV